LAFKGESSGARLYMAHWPVRSNRFALPTYLAALVIALNNLSVRLTGAGRRDDALAAIEEAAGSTAAWRKPTPPPPAGTGHVGQQPVHQPRRRRPPNKRQCSQVTKQLRTTRVPAPGLGSRPETSSR
jgi:hypothetical protein